ncbi:hypothetical protein BFJ72_g9630 [Fusarium proliferatum]|uniref:Uncharacterized protein n=1 Tax=Gibberella intermedia TaxID=948311 RepID=A0A420SXY7_GIBIN|nr:hypothetical protein BFJ72_g9630 [Fusarium proliferatum]
MLPNARNKSPRHTSAILSPRSTILNRAALLVTYTPMHKQHRHPHRVRPHHSPRTTHQRTRAEAKNQIAQVIRVARPSPPTAAEEKTPVLPAIGGPEGCYYVLCRFTPDGAFSAGASYDFLLVVHGPEEDVTCYSEGEKEC